LACFAPLFDEFADSLGYEAGDANLRRYVGNDPVDSVDPTGLVEEEKPQGKIDEEAFRAALKKNGIEKKIIDLIIAAARETPVPGGNFIGSHQVCADWVFTFEMRLDEDLKKALPRNADGTPGISVPGIVSRRYLILDVPLGAQGNKLDDISFFNKNWILPTLIDWYHVGGPARNGSALGMDLQKRDAMAARKAWLHQIHTVYKADLADGSVWYIDLGAIQSVRAADGSIDDLNSGKWHVTPSTSLPDGWTPTKKTAQPSWAPRED